MATAVSFPDVKPWPDQPNPRAALGGNKPPLEESILMEFDEALRDHDGLLERIDALVVKADGAKPCTTDDLAGRYGDFIKMTAAVAKTIEAEREKLNRPLLTAQRALKGRADTYAQRAAGAGTKVRALLDAYLAEKEAERRREVARLAEIERQAAAERQRAIDEANRIAREAAELERRRLQAIEDERAAAEAREAKAIEVEPEPVFVPEPEPAFVSAPVAKAPLRGDYGTAVSTTEHWYVEVENIRQVPDTFLKHPSVLEALAKVIAPSVRGKNGLREIKGCRIWSTVGSSVR